MTQTLTIKTPSDEELHTLLNNADQIGSWMIRERVPYSDGPEFTDHEIDTRTEAFDLIHQTRFSEAVASDIVVIRVEGDVVEEMFEGDDDTQPRVNLKMGSNTKVELDKCKRDGETWDECLRRLAQLDRATRQ